MAHQSDRNDHQSIQRYGEQLRLAANELREAADRAEATVAQTRRLIQKLRSNVRAAAWRSRSPVDWAIQTPTECPHCGSAHINETLGTSIVQYFRCAPCGHMWFVPKAPYHHIPSPLDYDSASK